MCNADSRVVFLRNVKIASIIYMTSMVAAGGFKIVLLLLYFNFICNFCDTVIFVLTDVSVGFAHVSLASHGAVARPVSDSLQPRWKCHLRQ